MEINFTEQLSHELRSLCAFYVGRRHLPEGSGIIVISTGDGWAWDPPRDTPVEVQSLAVRYEIHVGSKWLDLAAYQTIIYPDEHQGNWQYQDGNEIVTRFLNGEETRLICQE